MVTAKSRPFRAMGRMGVVAGAHVALLFAVASGFGLLPKAKLPPDLVLTPIYEPPHTAPPAPTPVVEKFDPDIHVPPPDAPPIDNFNPDVIQAQPMQPDEIPAVPEQVVPDPIPMTGVRPDPRYPLTQPRYPADMIRNGAQGAVEVEIYVQPDGRVADARIAKSSGFGAFDRSTLQEAHSWRLLPAMRGNEKLAQWYRLRVVFNLRNQ